MLSKCWAPSSAFNPYLASNICGGDDDGGDGGDDDDDDDNDDDDDEDDNLLSTSLSAMCHFTYFPQTSNSHIRKWHH